jgi:hypothetical protein
MKTKYCATALLITKGTQTAAYEVPHLYFSANLFRQPFPPTFPLRFPPTINQRTF